MAKGESKLSGSTSGGSSAKSASGEVSTKPKMMTKEEFMDGLPELQGSEKQVKWANDIRNGLANAFDDEYNQQSLNRTIPPVIEETLIQLQSAWKDELMETTKAKDIIDAKGMSGYMKQMFTQAIDDKKTILANNQQKEFIEGFNQFSGMNTKTFNEAFKENMKYEIKNAVFKYRK